MWISDVSVKRPVMATVFSALLVAFGVIAFDRLPLREYPDIEPAVVSVNTNYSGASAAVVENKITEIIEDRIAGVEGIKSISSTSQDGRSRIRIEFNLGRDIDNAANDVRDRVSRTVNNLPEEADPPEVLKAGDDDTVIYWVHLVAPAMNALELTDYVRRYLEDRFSAVEGVSRVRVTGQQVYSMRIWIDRDALVARRLTVSDVEEAIRRQNIELPAGTLQSVERDFVIRVERAYQSAEDFQKLVLRRGDDGYLVRLSDVARVELGSAERRSLFRGNGKSMVGMGIVKQSTANALTVARAVNAEIDRVNAQLPEGMELIKSYDKSLFVEAAVKEVYRTLIIAAALVVLVIFLFLGDPRSVLVPAATVPISLISTFIMLYALGYSINLLTLLALVLSIGLVVDDCIVVLENIHRRLARGESPLVAAYKGSRQVGFAVIATTLVLVAVFVPITLLEGNIGRLFSEFAVTMAVAVCFSTLVALTLAPVICSRLLRPDTVHNRLADAVDVITRSLENRYRKILGAVIRAPAVTITVLLLSIAASAWLFQQVPQEYAPQEDRGIMFMAVSTPEGSSFDYTVRQLLLVEEKLMPLVEAGEIKRLLIRAPSFSSGEAFNGAFAILVLSPWDSGRRDTFTILNDARARVADVPGARIFLRVPRSLGGGSNQPVDFVLGGNSYEDLADWQQQLLQAVEENPNFVGPDTDLKPTKPQLRIAIDRDRAGDLGVNLFDISRTLETLMGSRKVTTFILGGKEYDVIVEGAREAQRTLTDLQDIYVRSAATAELIPLSNLVHLREQADAGQLHRYNRVRAVTLSSAISDDYSLGEALDWLEDWVRTELPSEASFDFKGESLEYKTAGRSVLFTFALALLVVFLVMAAQFESFVHPFIILLAVPLALIGGLGGLLLFGQSLNIFSQVGLIMLVGLATKNGILIVEFINQLRDAGRDFEDAIINGAAFRLRPIMMTSVTTVFGAIPLVVSAGPGSETRTVIGIVVMCGVATASVITLFAIPVAYKLLARNTQAPGTVARELEQELSSS
ncbi:MAG: efflux RND transporter permease subunit [Halieaceae bacterium]